MSTKRRLASLIACAATIACSLSPLARHLGGMGGVSAAAWQSASLAVGCALLAASLALLIYSGPLDHRIAWLRRPR